MKTNGQDMAILAIIIIIQILIKQLIAVAIQATFVHTSTEDHFWSFHTPTEDHFWRFHTPTEVTPGHSSNVVALNVFNPQDYKKKV